MTNERPDFVPACRAGLLGAALWAALLVLGVGTAAATDDPYLESLKSEAGKVTDLTRAREEQRRVQAAATQARSASRATTATPAPAGGSRAELEQALRNQFPGTLALYLKFSEADKLQVVREFENSNASGIARYHPVINKVVQISIARY